jgi:cytoskeletal protein CcmA (bactofilin family)
MFGGKSKTVAEPTLIGRGAVIEGTLRAEGRIQVDGRIEGTLEVRGEVSIGPNGSVIGELIADHLAVGGNVQGKIHARAHLHVLAGGSVRGEVRYDTLQVDRGGVIDGTTSHGEQGQPAQPAAQSARAESVPEMRAEVSSIVAIDLAKAPPPPLPAGNRVSAAG